MQTIVLGGHSLGGLLAIRYAERAGPDIDVDGLVIIAFHLGDAGNAEGYPMIVYCHARTTAERLGGSGSYLCPGTPPGMMTCEEAMQYAPTADPARLAAACAQYYEVGEPIGFDEAARIGLPDLTRIDPDLRVRLVQFQYDRLASAEGDEARSHAADTAEWQNQCACNVTAQVVPDTGHLFQVHRNQRPGYDALAAWLDAWST